MNDETNTSSPSGPSGPSSNALFKPDPNRKVFQSRHMQSGVYNPDTRELTLSFVNGSSKTFIGVEPDRWRRLYTAPSAGTYFHQWVKDRYEIKKPKAEGEF